MVDDRSVASRQMRDPLRDAAIDTLAAAEARLKALYAHEEPSMSTDGRFRSRQSFQHNRCGVLTMSTLNVNDREYSVDVDPGTPVLWALRDTLGMTGTKFGCGAALCGACTVHLNGQAIRSCVTPISAAAGKKITTIEAATSGGDRVGSAVHAAWVKHDVAQCGYCQSGQIMSAIAFLKSLPRGNQPTASEIDSAMAGNICRCGTYARIRVAVADAAKALA
jgi:isoquinoline 1-oxidoreductase alpha subunit